MAAGIFVLASCNKDVPPPTPITPPSTSGQTIAEILNDPGYSILKAAVTKAGMLEALGDKTAVYTVFAPTDAAFALSGISAAAINAMPADQVAAIVRYHIVGGQAITSSMIPTTVPNLQLPTQLVLAPPSATLPPGLRMSIFPSKKGNAAWVNNIPLTGVDIQAANGVIHKTATVVAPPTVFLWNRIATDPNLTYLKAAIQRADEGATPATSFEAILQNPAASLTVFAPTDAAFKQVLTLQITGALMAPPFNMPQAQASATAIQLASTPAVFTNPQLASILTPTNVQGLIAYHVLGFRDFSVNFPTTATTYKTILNTVITSHPGVSIQATFGPTGVTAATVKGVANQTAANVQINPLPGGTSDQHYINGVLHEIDQVLLPQ